MGDLTDPEDVEELVLAGFVPEEPEDGSVRLQGSRLDYMGRVEVYHNHQWGSVCGFQWDRADAEVVCRQMGYDTGRVIAVTRPEFGPANDIPVYYNYVDCDGSEERLADCYAKKNFSRDGKFTKICKYCFKNLRKFMVSIIFQLLILSLEMTIFRKTTRIIPRVILANCVISENST